jgi:hypothetical protein
VARHRSVEQCCGSDLFLIPDPDQHTRVFHNTNVKNCTVSFLEHWRVRIWEKVISRIRIRIRLKGRIRIRIRIRLKGRIPIRIRICIKVKSIFVWPAGLELKRGLSARSYHNQSYGRQKASGVKTKNTFQTSLLSTTKYRDQS